jgi:16S rRNA (cytidine1402-2'-O)-methyltransferase
VVEGAPAPGPQPFTPGELARRVAVREAAGERRKEAIAAVAAEAALPKREVFDAVVRAKNAPQERDAGEPDGPDRDARE